MASAMVNQRFIQSPPQKTSVWFEITVQNGFQTNQTSTMRKTGTFTQRTNA